jgi:hypothetical protein
MINTSNEYKQVILSESRKFYGGATITLLDSTVLNLDNTRISAIKINDATSPDGQFTIGSTIINKAIISINNMDEAFSDYDFNDAIIRPTIGLQLSETIETLSKGVFNASNPRTIGPTINISARDNMAKFDTLFIDVVQTFPCTAQTLLSSVCLHCGVVLATSTFMNNNYIIAERPDDDAINCREIISWIAQISGNFARCNTTGALELKWYDFEVFELPSADGGVFDASTPYASGDSIDGGNFTDYNSGDTFDGGNFEDMDRYHHIFRTFGNSTIATDDVVITGISVTDSSETPTTALFGSSGYIIALEGNKLIQTYAQAQTIANTVGTKIVGMRFRPLSVNALSDPSREAGDVAFVSDRKGNSYQAIISNYSFGTRQHDKISSDAEPPSRKSAVRYSADIKSVIEARKNTQRQISTYDLAVQQLTNLITYGYGLHKSQELQPDGSYKYYMHNQPTIAESSVVWTINSGGLSISTDHGITWGVDTNGNMLVNVLTAIGINATWINAGEITGIKITTQEGQIGPFSLSDTGLFSDYMRFYDDGVYPLIWLNKPGVSGGDYADKEEGSAQANYEPSVVLVSSVDNGYQTDVTLLARPIPGGLHGGIISIDKIDLSTGAIVETRELSMNGLVFKTFDSSGTLVEQASFNPHIGLSMFSVQSGKAIYLNTDLTTGTLNIQADAVYINGTLQ